MTDLLNIHPMPTTSINSRSHQPNIPSILKQMEQQNDNNSRQNTIVINNYNYGNIGAHINHVEHFDAHFDKDMGLSINGYDLMETARNAAKNLQQCTNEEWIDEIAPCFFGDKAAALEFVRLARTVKKKPIIITELVNAWLETGRISPISCRRVLYNALHDHGIYDKTESNWNQQVKIPKHLQ